MSFTCGLRIKKDKRMHKKTNEEFIDELKNINPSIIPLEDYKCSTGKILYRCSICGYEGKAIPANLLQGAGCYRCSKKKTGKKLRKTDAQFKKELIDVNPYILPLESYSRKNEKILCRCTVCNYEWKVVPDSLLGGHGCPKCSFSQTSFVEQIIYQSMVYLFGEGNVINRDKSAIGKELDIFIPDRKIAIEFGAWYWHKDRLSIDFEKQELCRTHGIEMYILFEGCNKKSCNLIEPQIVNNVFYYSRLLSTEKNFLTTKEWIKSLCLLWNVDSLSFDSAWDNIVQQAKVQVGRKNEIDFVSALSEINTNIEYISGYVDSRKKVIVRCKICNSEWRAIPYTLLKGYGCHRCSYGEAGKRRRKDPEQFRIELKRINPNIVLLETYTTSGKNILCKCDVCGKEWQAKPSNLLKNHGCPQCRHKDGGKGRRKNKKIFVEELKRINPNILLLDNYEYSDKKIMCKCLICGHEWKVTPTNLRNGSGCPICRNTARKVKCLETNMIYDSIIEAERETGIASTCICRCCKGKQQTAGKYHWEYV